LRERWRSLRLQRGWLLPFGVLLAVSVFGDLAGTPPRNLLPVYVEAALHRQPYVTSALTSVRLLLGGLSAFAGGMLTHRLGRKRIIVIGLFSVPLTGGLLWLHSPLGLLLLSALVGCGTGAYYFGADSYMMATVPLAALGTATALLNGAQTLGGALGNSLAGPVVDRFGFGALGLGVAGLGLVLVAASNLLPPEHIGEGAHSVAFRRGDFGRLLRRRPVLLLAALRFLPTIYYGTISLLMPLLIYRVAGVPSAAAYYGTVTLLSASGCQLLAGRICDRFGRPVVAIGCTALMALTSLATPLFLHSLAGLFLCGTVGIAVAWGLTVVVPGLICDISAPAERPQTLATIHVTWYVGMITGSQAAGWLIGLGEAVPFLVMFVVNVASLVAAVALVRGVRRQAASSRERAA
jgi:MFS transporter, ACDE family, multidrug resistance protein